MSWELITVTVLAVILVLLGLHIRRVESKVNALNHRIGDVERSLSERW